MLTLPGGLGQELVPARADMARLRPRPAGVVRPNRTATRPACHPQSITSRVMCLRGRRCGSGAEPASADSPP
jgi:hypothetical protein